MKVWRSYWVLSECGGASGPSNTHTHTHTHTHCNYGNEWGETHALPGWVGDLTVSLFLLFPSLPSVVFSSERLFNLAGFSRVGHHFFFEFWVLPNLSGTSGDMRSHPSHFLWLSLFFCKKFAIKLKCFFSYIFCHFSKFFVIINFS